jgi:hypothetical protein
MSKTDPALWQFDDHRKRAEELMERGSWISNYDPYWYYIAGVRYESIQISPNSVARIWITVSMDAEQGVCTTQTNMPSPTWKSTDDWRRRMVLGG